MEKGDSALLRSAFHSGCYLDNGIGKEGKFTLGKETDVQGFATAIGTPHADAYHEPIWEIKTEQDGNFAQVWVEYAFYLGNKFSHCGVDTFQLIKTESGWKIFYLADTRQKNWLQHSERDFKEIRSEMRSLVLLFAWLLGRFGTRWKNYIGFDSSCRAGNDGSNDPPLQKREPRGQTIWFPF